MSLALLPRQITASRHGCEWTLSSPVALKQPPATLGDLLRRGAERAPTRDFLIEREGEGLRRMTWRETLAAAEGVASFLLRTNSERQAVLALSGASIDHALLMLGCFLAGVPFVPVSPAYSLVSGDFAKLKRIAQKVKPALVYVDNEAAFGRALAMLAIDRVETSRSIRARFDEPTMELPDVAPDDIAKILFTSGSTGFPKGVPNTHRMLCANQQMIAQLWPFLEEGEPPVLVDWLPWSHCFGGNHNFNMVLFHGGTLFIDQGKPTDALMPISVRNLREVSPTLYFNVPAGYAALVPRLESDEALRRAFFDRLQVAFYAAAALPDDLWQRLRRLADRSHADVFLTTAWGSTETSPLATSAHFPLDRAGNIGLPAPGVTLKLVPNASKLEARVKGPNVMCGYWDEPELTRAAFDEDGFYRIGDAVRFADPDDPSQGLLFDGRVAEDFKLMSGTWVSVGTLRTRLLAWTSPHLADLVIAGQDRESLCVLAWPSAFAAPSAATRAAVRDALARWNAEHPEGSSRIARVILLSEPPSLDAGEITDKGYVNQRATLECRTELVNALYASEPSTEVIVL